MGESVGVSVCFGKYENDAALCWEKWSTFSTNKYLEEVGKCSTPGSVAQKKAFFEANLLHKQDSNSDCTQFDHHHDGDGSATFQPHEDEQPMQVNVELPTTLNSNASAAAVLVNLDVESMNLVKPQFNQPNPQNVTPKKVEKNPIGMKKKPASVVPKSPAASTLSKPKPTSAPTLNKASAPSSSSKNKSHSLSESIRATPVSMTCVNSVTSSRRPSLFMEQMGDKDIVKRAFKTFQNRVNQLPSSDTKRSEQKTWTSMKENERSRKAHPEKVNPARGRLGPTWKSGSLKGLALDERQLKAGPTSVALNTNERAETRKEFLKKLEEKSIARSEVSLKSKEVKDAGMKKVRQKAKAMPGYRTALEISKQGRGASKVEVNRQK